MGVKSVVLAVLVLGAPATVSAQSWAIQGAEQYFRVESTTTPGRRGPVVAGYIYSTYGHHVDNVRLIIEGLDGAGQVISSTVAQVLGSIPPFGRAYFEAAAPGAATTTYRVRVASYDLVGRGGQ